MNYSDLLQKDFTGKTVVIIGRPASGKTTLALKLARLTGIRVVHTDNYIHHGISGLYAMIEDDLMEKSGPVIIEGVWGCRLLRRGMEGYDGWFWQPDIIIELLVTDEQVERVYREQRQGKDASRLGSQAKGLETVLREYKAMENANPPEWYTVQNDQF